MSSVSLRQICKSFGDTPAVVDFTLSIADGEFVALVGPSGCGKTTSLQILAGLEMADSGRIVLDGEDITHAPSPRRNMAMVFQNYALYPHMTVAENMGFALRMQGVSRPEIARRVGDAAAMLDIVPLLGRRPRELSGGQRQRVAVCRAIVRDPKLFLFDEPLSNLDAKLRSAARVELRQLQRRLKATTVYVTHDQIEAMTMADRIVVMNHGRIEQIDTPMRLYEEPASVFVASFLGNPPMNLLPAIFADEAGMPTYRLGDLSLPAAAPAPAGAALVLGLRPEAIALGAGPAGAMGFTARVDSVEHLGAESVLHLVRDGLKFQVRRPERIDIAADTMLPINFPAAALRVFDADNGRRLT